MGFLFQNLQFFFRLAVRNFKVMFMEHQNQIMEIVNQLMAKLEDPLSRNDELSMS